MLNVHPEAVRRFNERARELVDDVSRFIATADEGEASGSEKRVVQDCFRPDVYTKTHITEKDVIGEIKTGKVDHRGDSAAYCIRRGGREYWIEGDLFHQATRLADSVYGVSDIRDYLSRKFIQDTLFEWLEHRVADGDLSDFMGYLDSLATEKVEPVELRAPVANLHLQDELQMGIVRLMPLSRGELDAWEKQMLDKASEHRDKIEKMVREKIRPMQGHVCACVSLTAEPQRAQEILLFEAERAVAILRFFSVAALHPEATSCCVLKGQTEYESTTTWEIREGQFSVIAQSIKGAPRARLRISSSELKQWRKAGLGDFIEMLSLTTLSQYERMVLDSALLYSHCTVVSGVPEQLTYIYAALESAFIRNDSEPIQSNLAERIAFAIEADADGRREVIRIVKSAYKLRSQFLHHGESVDDLDAVERFMLHAWRAVVWLASHRGSFKTKDEMLDELERRKLS